MADKASYVIVASIGSAYGVKGWLNLHSYAEPADNVLRYKNFFVGNEGAWTLMNVDAIRAHGKNYVIKLAGCEDRTQAECYRSQFLAVDKAILPELSEDEYYWHQLIGLRVIVQSTGQLLGEVHHLLETGSNDVLVVRGTEQSIDQRERLLPYRPECVISIDLSQGQMWVDWDADF